MDIISSLVWIKRGAAKAAPTKVFEFYMEFFYITFECFLVYA